MKDSMKLFEIAVIIAGLLVLPLLLVIPLNTGLHEAYAGKGFGISLGMISYIWMLESIVISTRPKWMEKKIGLLDMYKIHGTLGTMAIFVMLIHNIAMDSSGPVKTAGQAGLILSLIAIAFSFLFFTDFFTVRIPALCKFREEILKKYINHEISVWIHRANLLAATAIFFHVSLNAKLRSNIAFYSVFFLVTLAAAVLYGLSKYKLFVRPDSGTVADIQRLDDTVLGLSIKAQPEFIRSIKPGSFLFVCFPEYKGLKEYHPFSVVKKDKETFYIAVSENGDFTRKLKELKPDAEVFLSGSYGILQKMMKESGNKPVVMIGGGIGVTPLISLINGNLDRKIYLFYSVNRTKRILFKDVFEKWMDYPFIKVFVRKSRFTVDDIVKAVPNHETMNYIISGPSSMTQEFYKDLIKSGVDENSIYFESFSLL